MGAGAAPPPRAGPAKGLAGPDAEIPDAGPDAEVPDAAPDSGPGTYSLEILEFVIKQPVSGAHVDVYWGPSAGTTPFAQDLVTNEKGLVTIEGPPSGVHTV